MSPCFFLSVLNGRKKAAGSMINALTPEHCTAEIATRCCLTIIELAGILHKYCRR